MILSLCKNCENHWWEIKVGRHCWDVHPLPHHTNSDGPTERYQFICTLMAPPKDINQVIISLFCHLWSEPVKRTWNPYFQYFFTFLLARASKKPPILITMVLVIIGRTADDLKAFLCESNWWDHSFTISEFDFIFHSESYKLRMDN